MTQDERTACTPENPRNIEIRSENSASVFYSLSSVFNFLFVCILFVCLDNVFQCSLGCPGTCYVDEAGLKFLPTFASQVWGLKVCTATYVGF